MGMSEDREKRKGITRRGFMGSVAASGAALGIGTLLPKEAEAGVVTRNIVTITVNGQKHELEIGNQPNQIQPEQTLAETLRETLGLTGTKISCDHGACGLCTVIMDGKAVLSCTLLTVECDGRQITTVEGLEDSVTGKLDPLQQAFIDHTAFQCGFCTPGILMSSKALLMQTPTPTAEQVKHALSGNFCRCISHYHVVDAVMAAGKGR
jgi:aerobic-type carbon monoxide dehydrogenase small subunit (CoxS/CutS family)